MTQWPGALRPLVLRHGPATVYAAGLSELGYPPTWVTDGREVLALTRLFGG